jgi:two-component system alkaline phosphatase synthesis response regulator PhoP
MAKILVCDDTPDILEMVKFILEGEGFEVLTASEGRDVLSVIGRENPDLVLLDLRMPGLDGFGVLRELRLKPDEAPPVVVLSAKGLEEDKRAALAAGARDYLFKPFTLAQLLQAIRRQLGEEG